MKVAADATRLIALVSAFFVASATAAFFTTSGWHVHVPDVKPYQSFGMH